MDTWYPVGAHFCGAADNDKKLVSVSVIAISLPCKILSKCGMRVEIEMGRSLIGISRTEEDAAFLFAADVRRYSNALQSYRRSQQFLKIRPCASFPRLFFSLAPTKRHT